MKEVVSCTKDFYRTPFANRPAGKFLYLRRDLAHLLQIPLLTESCLVRFNELLVDECGLFVFDLGDVCPVLSLKLLGNYRALPSKIVEDYRLPEGNRRTFPEVAEILADLTTREFGGKLKGRFQLARADLAVIYGARVLLDGRVVSIFDELIQLGFYLNRAFGDQYAVVDPLALRRYRQVPAEMVAEALERLADVEIDPSDLEDDLLGLQD